MRAVANSTLAIAVFLLAACGPTPEQQRADDQNRCIGYGFQPSTDAFAHCMMTTASQRDAQQAADRRAAAARQAAADRQNAAINAQKDAADRDAWDRTTHQGAYANSPSAFSPPQFPASSSSNPVDAVRNSIQDDMDKMEHAGTLSQ